MAAWLQVMNTSAACVDVNAFLWANRSDLSTRPVVFAVFGALYSLVFVAAVVGNCCVIAAVAKNPPLRSVRNLFIVSLSCSDIAVNLVSGTVTPAAAFAKVWLFGRVLCSVVPLIQAMSICISTFTLTAIAFDRYILVVHPTRRPISRRQAIGMIAGIWALAAAVALPMVLRQKIERYAAFCGEFCVEDWRGLERQRLAYGTGVLAATFILPLTIIIFCYTRICIRLGKGILHQKQNGTQESAQRRLANKRRHRTNRMLIAMVAVFASCWSLQVVYNTLRDYEKLPIWVATQQYFYGILTHCIAMTSTVWNPVLYAWLNLQLRHAFIGILPAVCQCSGGGGGEGSRRRLGSDVASRTCSVRLRTTANTNALSFASHESPTAPVLAQPRHDEVFL